MSHHIYRRALLASAGVALLAAGCARPTPKKARARSATVTTFGVTTTRGPRVSEPPSTTCAAAFADQTAADAEWFSPVLRAFNDAHPGLRAVYASEFVDAKLGPGGCDASGNHAVSAWIGGRGSVGGSVDLAPILHRASFDGDALLPGLLAAVTTGTGRVVGLPVDFTVTALHYDAAALQRARIPLPPAAGWNSGEFASVIGALASAVPDRLQAFGWDLSVPGGMAAFLAYGQGFGGQIYSGGAVTLTSPAVLQGLTDYADLLQLTWVGMQGKLPSTPVLNFDLVGWSAGGKAWPAQGYTRFPRLPIHNGVPATLWVAYVPKPAPQPDAGAQFVVWLVSAEGQKAMTALGYPPVRRDGNLANSWLSREGTGIAPSDLLFEPIAGASAGFGDPVNLDYLVVPALSLPDRKHRQAVLKVIEQAANANLAGTMTWTQGEKQVITALMAAGITDFPAQTLRLAGMATSGRA